MDAREKAIANLSQMFKNAEALTEALGLPRSEVNTVMAALYKDRLPQHVPDETIEPADMDKEEAFTIGSSTVTNQSSQAALAHISHTLEDLKKEVEELNKSTLEIKSVLGITNQAEILKIFGGPVGEYATKGAEPDSSVVLSHLQQKPDHHSTYQKQGLLLLLSGIAGFENDKVISELKKEDRDIFVSQIVTTRLERIGESPGEPHSFISEEDFQEWITKGMLLTYVHNEYIKNRPPAWYGHLEAPIIQRLRRGHDVIIDAGPEEAAQVRRNGKLNALLILLRPPRDIRDEEDHKRWEERIQRIKDEYQIEYDYIIDYEPKHLTEAVNKLYEIIKLERKKVRGEQIESTQTENQTSSEETH